MGSPIPITIIGAGITGLSSALHLTVKYPTKYKITVIARDLPGDLTSTWASPWAGAIFQPLPTTNPDLQEMQKASFRFYHNLTQTKPSSETGVQTYPSTEYYDSVSPTSSTPDASNTWIHKLMPDFKPIPREHLPKDTGVTSGVNYTTLAINPRIFLPYLHAELSKAGVRFVRAEVKSIDQARSLTPAPPALVINASGVGARELAQDESVLPIRGQTMFLKTDYARCMMLEGKEYTYIIPRPQSGGVIIGGVKQPGRTDAVVDEHVRTDILRRVNALTGGAFKDVDLVKGRAEGSVVDVVGFRPGREGGLRVEIDERRRVVHAYGAGGAGYIYSFGVAQRVGNLVEKSLNANKSRL